MAHAKNWFRKGSGVARLHVGRGTVPEGARALLSGGSEGMLPAGSVLEGDAIVVRAREFPVNVRFDHLEDRDGIAATLSVRLLLEPPPTRTAALLLRDAFLSDTDAIDAEGVAKHLAERVRPALVRALSAERWSWDDDVLPRLAAGEVLPGIVQAPLFDMGLSLLSVDGAAAESEELELRRQRRGELRQEAQRVNERLQFIDLWKREETGDALARHDVERLAAHLRKEGLLTELEVRKEVQKERVEIQQEEARSKSQLRRMLERERLAAQMEIDAERLDYEIAKAQRWQKSFSDAGLLGVIQGIEDTPTRERLIESLIEKEMTPEQIEARAEQKGVADLSHRVVEMVEELKAEIRGGTIPTWTRSLPNLSRIWLAAGLALYRIDGDAAFRSGEPTPVLPPEDIGYLRSVNVIFRSATEPAKVLVGAQAAVATYDPLGSHWSVHRYRPTPRGRGGANAVTGVGRMVLATHSEMGLYLWNGESGPRGLFSDRIVPGISTRGIHLGPGGCAYFSHGADVYRIDPSAPGERLESCGTLPESITALASSGERLVVGTRKGRLFQWAGGDEWQQFSFQASGPVFQISSPSDAPDVGWIVGARASAVHVLDANGDLLVNYRSRYPIRWAAAGRQGVLGVDRFGQHLLLWSWSDPRAPIRRIRVPDQIQYLAVERGQANGTDSGQGDQGGEEARA